LRLVNNRQADFIFFGMLPSSHAMVLKDAARLGVRRDFQDLAFWGATIVQIKNLVGDLANGTMMLTDYNLDPDSWETPYFTNLFKASNAPLVAAAYYSAGAAFLGVKVEAIRRAAQKVGVKNVDGEAVYNALINMKRFHPPLNHGAQSFSKTKCVGPDKAVIYQLQDGKLRIIARDIYIPNLLPGGKDVVK